MKKITLIFPNQLFEDISWIDYESHVFLIEEILFFRQYNFHKHKLIFHRSSMKFYYDYLNQKGYNVSYIESHEKMADVRNLISQLKAQGASHINIINCDDNYLQSRINKKTCEYNILLNVFQNQCFLNSL